MSTPLTYVLGLAFFLTACGQPSEASKAPLSKGNGHYEGKDAADMARYMGKQSAVPEFSPVRAVLVSHQPPTTLP